MNKDLSTAYSLEYIDYEDLSDYSLPLLPPDMYSDLAPGTVEGAVKLNNVIIACPEDINNLMEFLLELKQRMLDVIPSDIDSITDDDILDGLNDYIDNMDYDDYSY